MRGHIIHTVLMLKVHYWGDQNLYIVQLCLFQNNVTWELHSFNLQLGTIV